MDMQRRSPRTQILCCRGTACSAGGSESIFSAFMDRIEKRGLKDEARAVMTGCHGLCEIGPIVVIYPEDLLYCQVTIDDVDEIVEETLLKGRPVQRLLYKDPMTAEVIPHYHDIPFYRNQKRIILRNNGLIDPERIEEYIANDGYAALCKVLNEMSPDDVIQTVLDSGLRGRGGAGFPTGLKWSFARRAVGDIKYVVCNADEGDPGAFMDRSLIEGDPHSVIEGMTIAAYAIGASKGFVYCRAEYPLAIKRLRLAISQAKEYGLLGENIFDTDFSFDLEVMEGAGAFVCGEETALMASIEGRRGEPRPRPPFPANSGLWGKPTNINNVKSYATVPQIILKGSGWFSSMGTANSKGTAVFALTGKVNNTGLIEVPMGITIGEIVFDVGGGVAKGKKYKAVQMGGPLGGCLPADFLNTPVDYESITATGAIMGSGGMIVVDEDTCMVELAKFFLQFSTDESCGKCIPCRVGGKRLLEILERISKGEGTLEDIDTIEQISEVMEKAALCNLGQLTPNPVITTLKYFKEEYLAHIIDKRCPAGVCEALVPAPCRATCPAEVNVPIYVAHIAEGEYKQALAVHRESNPFPAICGRVCPAFCETRCRRGELDEPVAIRTLKRFMVDQEGEKWEPQILEDEKEQSIAVVGGGPSGLTAALRLAQKGYQVTIFEAESVLGGWMTLGIPDYRLPKDALNKEISSITDMKNVDVKTSTKIGKDVSLDKLKDEYDAVILAVGAMKSRKLGIPGEESEGVVHGTDFLKAFNLGEDVSYVKGKRTAVIGGGNVAVDAARTLIRLGAEEVNIVYRRRREDMPALDEEIKAAQEEGVKLMFLLTPIEVVSENGEMTGLRCQRMRLEDEDRRPNFDSSARKRPFPIEEAEVVLDVDMLVPAIGQEVDTSLLEGSESEVEVNRGTIASEERTFVTNAEGVFAIGDAVSGPASVIEAVGHGNKVAKVVERYLKGEEELMPPAEILQRPEEGIGEFEMAEEDGVRPRQKESVVAPEVRTGDFREVELGFPLESIAQAEARRCLRCDLEPIE